jgi:hypothetical protein
MMHGVPSLSLVLLAPALLSLAACNPPQTPQAQANAALVAACRQRADAVFTQQGRGEIYRPPPAVNTPFSAGFAPGVTNRGLSDQFAHDRFVNDCVRNTGTGEERSQAPAYPESLPSPPPPPPASTRP